MGCSSLGLLSCFLLCGAGSKFGWSDALFIGELSTALEDDDPPLFKADLFENVLHPAVLQDDIEP